MSSLAEFQKAVYAGLGKADPNASKAPKDIAPLAAQQQKAYKTEGAVLEAAPSIITTPLKAPKRPVHTDYNSNFITEKTQGHAGQSTENTDLDETAEKLVATMLGSSEITYTSDKTHPILWNQGLSDELTKSCGAKSLSDPAACFEGLKKAMADPKNTLGQSKESKTNAELFTYARSEEDILKLQTYLGVDVDGKIGPQTTQALAAHRAVYGESNLAAAFPRTDESIVVDALYTEFTRQGGSEGDKPHQAGDDRLTLAGGVVADGLKYDGIPVVQGTWADRRDFDPKKVNTAGAYKKVNGVTIKRSSFKTDAEFINASLEAFTITAKQSVEKAGVDWASLPKNIKTTIVSLGWNLGDAMFTNDDIITMYAELAKPYPKQGPLHKAFLTKATQTNGGAGVGIAKRRANDWNQIYDVLAGQKISTIEASYDTNKGSTATTIMTYRNKQGNAIFTYDTGRAHWKYENSSLEMNLNNKGDFVLNKNKPFVNPIPPVTSIRPVERPKLKSFGGK